MRIRFMVVMLICLAIIFLVASIVGSERFKPFVKSETAEIILQLPSNVDIGDTCYVVLTKVDKEQLQEQYQKRVGSAYKFVYYFQFVPKGRK